MITPTISRSVSNLADDLSFAEFAFRRQLLASARSATLQDTIEMGRAAWRVADREGALLLLAAAGLEMGFSPGAIAWWNQIGAQTGMWSERLAVATAAPPRHFVVDQALDELAGMARIAAEARDPGSALPVSGRLPATIVECASAAKNAVEAFLADPHARPSSLIINLSRAVGGWADIDLREHVGASTTTMARIVALNRFRTLVDRASEFLRPPLGSSALLDYVASLGDGLGPYLTNLQNVARDGRDVLRWAGWAAQDVLTQTYMADWHMLVATSLGKNLWNSFVLTLAHAGLGASLERALERIARLPIDNDDGYAANHLRDACIERGLAKISVDAQQLVVSLRPRDLNERIILGDMLGALGEQDKAVVLFEELLAGEPGNSELLARTSAVKSKFFHRYVERNGFFGDGRDGEKRRRAFALDVTAEKGTLSIIGAAKIG